MPYMKEHLDAGFRASVLVVGLLVFAYTRGIVPSPMHSFVFQRSR